MTITDFTDKDIEKAKRIALSNYDEERNAIPFLPAVKGTPDLAEFAKNRLGVAIYEGETMLGFLCGRKIEKFKTLRMHSPEYAHGAVLENRAKIYSRLYQAASKKWVQEKVLIHEITLYSHDESAKESFFNNVFGACIMYAAVDIGKDVNLRKCDDDRLLLCELTSDRHIEILPLQNELLSHLREAPVFLPYEKITIERFLEFKKKRYFAALDADRIIAYIRTQENAGNLVADDKNTINITGAYMYPEYRGGGVYTGLLSYLVDVVKNEGYKCISVDFETYNPNAFGFWTKYFTPYSTSLTRSVEHVILETDDIKLCAQE